MFTRKEALALLAEKFPVTTTTQKDYATGGTREVVWTPEKRLERDIDLHEPQFDGLKEGGEGLDPETADWFREKLEIQYKDENGLPR